MSRICRRSIFFALVCVAWSASLNGDAQDSKKTTATPPDHSTEAYVIEESTERWTFENNGTGTREETDRVRIQSDAGVEHFGVLIFSYQKAVESAEIDYVRVHKPDGSIIPTPMDDLQDMPAAVTREAPFYSDLREKHLAVKGLSTGDTLEYQCHWNVTKPLVPGQFWMQAEFSRDQIVLLHKLEVRVPIERTVKFKSTGLAPLITEEGKHRAYTWNRSNLDAHRRSRVDLAESVIRGRLPAPDVELSSFQSWEEIGRWYGGLQQDRIVPSAEIRAKAAELTRNAVDDQAKIQAIYRYVSTEYRYIGVAFGIGRYQPHSAAEVFSNQYGDCKDKHTLLATLLAAAGMPAYPALISSSRMIDPDAPSPGQFDHVITVVPRGNDLLWLDTTTEVGPFGYLVMQLRDKPALIVFPDKPASFQNTPANPPSTFWTFKINARIDASGSLEGKVEQTMRGDGEVELRAGLRSLSRAEWKNLIQRFSYGVGFGGEVSEVTASMPEATDVPLHFTYTYRRKQPGWEDRLISTPVPFVFARPPEEDGKLPERLWLDDPGEYDFESRVELPQGYRPFLPQNKDIKEEFAEYHSTYTSRGNILVARVHIAVKVAEISGSAVSDYKKMVEKLIKEQTRPISLYVRALTSATDSVSAFMMQVWELPESGDSKAVQAEHDARTAMEHGSLQLAQSALKRAVVQDPKCTRDWIFLAEVDMDLRQEEAVVESLRKAVDSDRQEPLSYKLLALTLSSRGKRSEAAQVWQDLSKVTPDDSDIPLNLGRLLLAEKHFGEAVPYLEKAIKLDLDPNSLLLDLGTAYLQNGADEQANKTFEQALKAQPGQMTKNNIAFAMANANKRLDDALRYSQEAVREEEEASREVQLGKLAGDDLRHTLNLGFYWDTLGWVLYRKGDLKRAEGYLYAAWTLCQTPTMGYHLAQLYEQEHRTSDATHLYRVISTQGSPSSEDVEAVNEAKARAGNPPTFGWRAGGLDLSGELSRQRTTILPRITDQATAEFFVLIGPASKPASGSQESAGATLQGVIEDVKFVSGSDTLKSSGDLLRRAHIKAAFPAESSGKLLRRGVLSCFPLSGCTFVLIPPDSVSQVN